MRVYSLSTARSRQLGMGMLGWLISLAIASFFLTCFLKVGPLYLDYWQARGVLEDVMAGAANQSKSELLDAIQKRLDVSRLDVFKAQDIRFNDTRAGRELDASYEKRVPLLSNIDVVVKFDKLKFLLPSPQ